MALEQMKFKIKGMQKDTTESLFSGEFAFENMNMSITARDNNTLLSLSTEQGNEVLNIIDLENDTNFNLKGIPLGYGIINNNLIIFTHSTNDIIYKIYKNNNNLIIGKELYKGNLNLDSEHPIETLSFYENQDIQKVYWTDGKNQLRFINVESPTTQTDIFDFIPNLQLKETVTIVKNDISDGLFPSGTIQYAFTYYNKYAQETNIFHVSNLFYTSFSERGGSPEDRVSNSFSINITNVDANFDYIRVYSIIRTSIDATPTVKRVADIPTKGLNNQESVDIFIEDITKYSTGGIYNIEYNLNSVIKLIRNNVETIVPINNSLNMLLQTNDVLKVKNCIINNKNTNVTSSDYSTIAFTTINQNNDISYSIDTSSKKLGLNLDGLNYNMECMDTINYSNTNPFIVLNSSVNSYDILIPGEFYPTYKLKGTNVVFANLLAVSEYYFHSGEILEISVHTTVEGDKIPFILYPNGYVDTNSEYIEVNNKVEVVMTQVVELTSRVVDSVTKNNMSFLSINPNTKLDEHSFNVFKTGTYIGSVYDLGNSYTEFEIDYYVDTIFSYMRNSIEYPITILNGKLNHTFENGDTLLIEGAFTLINSDYNRFIVNGKLTMDLISGINIIEIPYLKYQSANSLNINSQDVDSYNKFFLLSQIINSDFTFIDTNTLGETLDPTSLLYIGGERLISQTISQKDNTLFYGNIKIDRPLISDIILVDKNINYSTKFLYTENNYTGLNYIPNTLKLSNQRTFKSKEVYRFGLIAQHISGKWSEVLYIGDKENNILPVTNGDSGSTTHVYGAKATYILNDSNVIQSLISKGYVNIKGVVVYPQLNDRNVIAQGILNPTIYNTEDRFKGNVYAVSSWNFRPNLKVIPAISPSDYKFTEFRNDSFPLESYGNAEIQNNKDNPFNNNNTLEFMSNSHPNAMYIDRKIVTLNSPDIEFNENINLIEDINLKLRIIGVSWINKNYSDLSITASGPKLVGGGYRTSSSPYMDNINPMSKTNSWYDNNTSNTATRFNVYPWHGNRPLNDSSDATKTSILDKKKMSNLRYSYYNSYLTNPWTPNYNQIDKVSIFNSNEDSIIKVSYNNDKIIYKGNLDKILSGNYLVKNVSASEPVRIQYKSTPHAVFSFKGGIELPNINGNINLNNNNSITFPTTNNVGILIGELYRDGIVNRFGGNTPEALQFNQWLPCGNSVSLRDPLGVIKTSINIEYTEGDTFIQRYDALKSYAYNNDAQNSVVDIASFFVETHINLDARTDRNRGNTDNRLANPLNFNLINPVYNQKDNFFTYRTIDTERFNLNNFPNTISWTKTKIAGEIIDTWTNVTLASTLDLDGVYGPVNAINNFNNDLFAFQDSGISNILFNSRVQINASDGIPIEIANSTKVEGKRYLSTDIGTTNKWSIKNSIYGLYFIDNITKGIYLFNGKLENLSKKLGFHSWAVNNLNGRNIWNPSEFNNFVTHYDIENGNIYFINKDLCLVYSEQLQQFTSFMSYEEVPFMVNSFDKFLAIKKESNTNILDIWSQNTGKYNNYFNKIVPSSITVIANNKPDKDKIFNTLDIRADLYDGNTIISNVPFNKLEAWNEYQRGETELYELINKPSSFKQKFRSWRANIPRSNNNLQSNSRPINSNKFFKVDRMRNPWLYLKLTSNTSDTLTNDYNVPITDDINVPILSDYDNKKVILHDITVNYSI